MAFVSAILVILTAHTGWQESNKMGLTCWFFLSGYISYTTDLVEVFHLLSLDF